MSSVTFEQNLSNILSLKKEAQSLLQLYSKDIINFSHLQNLEHKTQQLKTALSDIEELKTKNERDNQMANLKLENTRTELNRSLSVQSELLQRLEQADHEKQELIKELTTKNDLCESLIKEKEATAQKFMREMENLKLMYTQELYIAKRFDKPR